MKKTLWTAMLGLTLAIMLCVPAMAQTTGIEVDGKTYAFTGGEGIYEADGKVFIIGTESVTIREEGKPDLVLSLVQAPDTEMVEDAVFLEQGSDSAAATDDARTLIAGVVQSAAAVGDSIATQSAQAMTQYVEFSYAVEDAQADDTERFAPYAPFGLNYDAQSGILTYQGQRVRIFEDAYPLEDQAYAALEHVDAQGTVDVKTTRDFSVRLYNADGSYNPAGTLTGLYALTDAEFAARDLRSVVRAEPQETAVSDGEEMTPEQRQAFFAPYAAFGLSYDAATDTLSYQGKRVRQFMDIRRSNGETLQSGRFQGAVTCIGGEEGEVDVETIRDFATPDAQGEGTLIGMSMEKVR